MLKPNEGNVEAKWRQSWSQLRNQFYFYFFEGRMFCNEHHWLFTVRSRSLQLWCVVYYRLAGKPQASCDRMLGSQQQGIKCRRFYYNMRSTIQLTLRPQALLHLRLAMAPRLTSGSTGQLWRARNHSLKSVDADGLMDLKSTALISKSNVSWFEISLLDNWYNKFWKHCTFHQCSFLN